MSHSARPSDPSSPQSIPCTKGRGSARPVGRIVATAAIALALVGACGSSGSSAGTSPAAFASGSPNVSASGGAASSGAPGQSGGSGSPTAPGGPSAGAQGGTGGAGSDLALQSAFESIVRSVGPSVVVVETNQGLGSGVVFDAAGDIVTNAHVAGSATNFTILTSAGDRLDGSLVGSFPGDDLAVVKASGGHLPPATFADSSKLTVGQIVLAIGNPLGLQSSVTDGIISALGRTVTEPGGAALPGVIQTSAPINPGNSGGALVDLSGDVIGIPTLTATDPQLGGAAPGIGFAVPSSTARDIATQLIQHGKVVSSHRAYLGIQAASVTGANGVLVFSVQPGGPADKAGIPADVLITSIAGKPTPDQQALASVLAGLSPGQTVDVAIERRDGSTDTIKVTLGELPG